MIPNIIPNDEYIQFAKLLMMKVMAFGFGKSFCFIVTNQWLRLNKITRVYIDFANPVRLFFKDFRIAFPMKQCECGNFFN